MTRPHHPDGRGYPVYLRRRGAELSKVSGGITREYIDGIEYNNGAVEFVSTEEGRAMVSGGVYRYEYYLKDHLGICKDVVAG